MLHWRVFFSIRLKSPNKQFFDQIHISLKNYAYSCDCCVKLSRIKYSANISIHNCYKEKPYLCYIVFCPIHSNVSGYWFWMTAGSTGKHMYESLLNFSEIVGVSFASYSEHPTNWTAHLFSYFPAHLSGYVNPGGQYFSDFQQDFLAPLLYIKSSTIALIWGFLHRSSFLKRLPIGLWKPRQSEIV